MMIVALVLFAAVILACMVAPSGGKPAKVAKPVAVEAPGTALQVREARA